MIKHYLQHFRNKTVFEISLKDLDIKSLVLQLKLMTLVMVYVEICARENAPVYCNKVKCIDMLNDAVAGIKQYITCWSPRPEGSYKIGSACPFVCPSVCPYVFPELTH